MVASWMVEGMKIREFFVRWWGLENPILSARILVKAVSSHHCPISVMSWWWLPKAAIACKISSILRTSTAKANPKNATEALQESDQSLSPRFLLQFNGSTLVIIRYQISELPFSGFSHQHLCPSYLADNSWHSVFWNNFCWNHFTWMTLQYLIFQELWHFWHKYDSWHFMNY